MAKQGINLRDIHPFIREKCKTSGWALCIGSGTSVPIFPDWQTLVKNLISRDKGIREFEILSNSLASRFSPDTLIDAAKDRLGYSSEEFAGILADELYKYVFDSLTPSEAKIFS